MSAEEAQLEQFEMPGIPREAAKKISHLEEEFTRAEVDQLRKSIPILEPLYQKRNQIITDPEVQGDFWIRVFSNAPAEIDEYILPTDAAVLGSALKNLTVERFEVNEKGEGEPRSIRLTWEFHGGEENPFFENEKIVKDFYWRKQVTKSAKGKSRTWEGLVSEPVRINWKKDMDLTKGLLDAACDLAEAEKKKGGDRKKLPEYESLVKKVSEAEAEAMNDDDEDDEDPSPAGISFFALFGYRGRDVTAEQSKEATKQGEERWAKIVKGEAVDEDDDDEDDDDEDDDADDLEEAEIFPDGEEVAISLAEDLWPSALKYYVQSFELSEELSEIDEDELEDLDDEEDASSHPRKKTKV
ncbi:hypothetical protein ASPWEDRAFT_115360 [Aspergillus wentii DTO 134E9]|uniref:BSD domain-containing protein n=1 Tax=Aspergillus wentii DTO 134E9 TaxID=1073089 RepID=A0A1L9RDG0_ASPWE|nr:uncharacterized protein ASPWEDRAFT_115360 [Aspergillus wentii DTO 134E9]KAI9933223.1 hypothetical protein MW887_007695 [Aspergillus wentii]OJJ32952.1 hypothetical protein ASPWEDRAFT_115360 [Aspergillus wentii DTO 134E9]